MKNVRKYAVTLLGTTLAAVSCGTDETEPQRPSQWGNLTAPVLTVSAERVELQSETPDEEALRFEWTPSAVTRSAEIAYDLYIGLAGEELFTEAKYEAAGRLSAVFTHKELNSLIEESFEAGSGRTVELQACVYARSSDNRIEGKASNEVLFSVRTFEATVVLPEELYMKGGACEQGWDEAVVLRRDGERAYKAEGVVLKFGKPQDNKGFKFYVEPEGSYPFYGQKIDGAFGEIAVFASENDGDSQFYPLSHGYTSGIYTVVVDLAAMRLRLDKTGDVEEFDPDAVLYILGDNMEYGWDMVEGNALVRTAEQVYGISAVRLKANSSFKFFFHDWTEFIRDESAADYWTLKRKSDGDGDIRFVPAEQGLADDEYDITVDLAAGSVKLVPRGATPSYPTELFLFGPATLAGWELGKFIPLTRTSDGIFVAEGVSIEVGEANADDPKGNGFKFAVSNTEWSSEYGAAGSFDDGYRGWGLVQGSDQFYPLLMGCESGLYRITADLAAGRVSFENM